MKLFRRKRKNNKGFSLVEVVCAVAILGLTSTAIGSAMIMSTKSYQRGSAEVDVQKEAQITTNLIGNLLIDATSVDYQEVAYVSKTLTINQEGTTYTLFYDEGTDVITYTEQVTGGSPVSGVLAENVVAFDLPGFSASDFKANKNAKVELSIEMNGKNYEATYSTTARNGASVNDGASEVAKIICENEVTLEPNHSYDIPIVVYGLPASEAGIDYSAVYAVGAGSDVGGTTLSNKTASGVTINLGNNAQGTLAFTITTKNDASGNPLDTKTVTINVRRVTDINFVRNLQSGIAKKAGAVYRIYAEAIGTNLDKKIGKAYDDNYKNPRFMDLEVSMVGGNLGTYVDIVGFSENVDEPYIDIKLLQDMPNGSKIIIKATSKHSVGTIGTDKYTKMGYGYDDVMNGTSDPVIRTHEIDNTAVITAENGLMRGEDCLEFDTILPLDALKTTYGGDGVWLFRYRPAGGTWSQYYKTKESGIEQKINTVETYLFEIDKAYEFQLMYACIDWANKTLEWPHDATLLTAGYGFTEFGITQGWTAEEVGVGMSATSPEQYSEVFPLGATELNFTGNGSTGSDEGLLNLPVGYDANGKDFCALTAGTAGNPYILHKSESDNISINYATVNLCRGKYNYAYDLQKYFEYPDGTSEWRTVDKSTYGLDNIAIGGGASSTYKVENIAGATVGHYRLCATIKNDLYGSTGAGSDISNLIITVAPQGVWNGYGDKVVEEGGVNKNVEYGYIYFDIAN